MAISFIEYVAIVNQTKEALEYDKQTEDDKKIIDNTRAARDKCVATRQ